MKPQKNRVSVDGNLCMWQFFFKIRNNGDLLRNKEGIVTSHISGFFYRLISMIEGGYYPIVCFDGPPHKLKKVQQKPEEFSEIHFRGSRTKSSIELLNLMGIPTVQCIHDAEAQCAYLTQIKNVDFANTKDADDCFCFGAISIGGENFTIGKAPDMITGKNIVKVLTLSEWLKNMNLPNWTREQYVDYNILIGTDYNDKLLPKGKGPKIAERIISGNVEKDLIYTDNYEIFKDVRYLHLKPEIVTNTPSFTEPDEEKLTELLVEVYDFNKNRAEQNIKKLKNYIDQMHETSLDDWFK